MGVSSSGQTEEVDGPQMLSANELLGTRVQNMLRDVEDMARSGETPKPASIQVIKDIIVGEDGLLADLKATRDSAAKQVKTNLDAIDTCNSNANTGLSSIKSTTEVSVGGERTKHATCREAEKGKTSNKDSKCSELDNFLSGVQVPADLPAGRPRDGMVSYVKTMSTYFCPKGPEVTKLDEACTIATEEHYQHKTDCDRKQAAFEMGFCTWRTELNDACVALSSCYQGALKMYNDHVSNTKDLVKKWKVEFAALKKIVCYTDVWLNNGDASTADADQLAACKSNTVDTSPMDVDYGTPAEEATCSLAAVANYPGTDGFVTTEYSAFKEFTITPNECLPLVAAKGSLASLA